MIEYSTSSPSKYNSTASFKLFIASSIVSPKLQTSTFRQRATKYLSSCHIT
ncbi:hypothetical protein ASZ90_003905 [hydrocarbon metagenome]|uniref:Uncharacterized protein n=1 Tax=hydrocarbon metagenome TaxID=938273 RepID=A0A0W8FZX8_9ZZZZ